jgi:hypothetical protein
VINSRSVGVHWRLFRGRRKIITKHQAQKDETLHRTLQLLRVDSDHPGSTSVARCVAAVALLLRRIERELAVWQAPQQRGNERKDA